MQVLSDKPARIVEGLHDAKIDPNGTHRSLQARECRPVRTVITCASRSRAHASAPILFRVPSSSTATDRPHMTKVATTRRSRRGSAATNSRTFRRCASTSVRRTGGADTPGDCALAREQYQAFLRDPEPSPQRSLAEQYLAQLATCFAAPTDHESADECERPIQTSTEARPSLANRRLAVVATGAGGAVLFLGGIYLGAHAHTLGSEVRAHARPPTGCSWTAEQSKDAAGRRDATVGYTFDALGVAAIVGVAAYYWFGVHAYQIQVAPVTAYPRENGATLSWGRTW